MKLYYCDLLAPRKACAVAGYLRSDVEYVYVDVTKGRHKRPEYLALNPNGTVPALSDGARAVWEADAIMCHLAQRAGSDLWPQDARQIDVLRWLSWNSQHFLRCGGELYSEHIIKRRFNIGPPDAAAVAEAQRAWRRYAGVLDAHLRGRIWLVGDAISVADFSVAITLPYAAQSAIPVDEFPEILRWHAQLSELPAWREPFPAR